VSRWGDCQSTYKPERYPGLEVQCSLAAGHKGFHQGMNYSWPNEDSPLSLNPNRALNPAELRSCFDLLSSLIGLIGFVLVFVGILGIWLFRSILSFVLFPGVWAIIIGVILIWGSYRIWNRSLRI
jgi:hypothetical protein